MPRESESKPRKNETLEETIARLLRVQKKSKISEIGEAILREWGGAEDFARAFKHTYDNAPAGSLIRAKLLERMLHFVDVDEKEEIEFDEEVLSAVVMELAQRHGRDGSTHSQEDSDREDSGGAGSSGSATEETEDSETPSA